MRRYNIDERWYTKSTALVYHTLSRAIAVGEETLPALYSLNEVREMEFLFPIPETGHPLLTKAKEGAGRWRVERGYIKGFVDLVFEHDGRVYWADWKTDTLPAYDATTLSQHVAANYKIQAELYTMGMARVLGLRDAQEYEERFGGYLYIFSRGMPAGSSPSEGIYFQRPSWMELCNFESNLQKAFPRFSGGRS
jgi:exodeoxyribonuclease V beta subunit